VNVLARIITGMEVHAVPTQGELLRTPAGRVWIFFKVKL
jgi:hypothetical protein